MGIIPSTGGPRVGTSGLRAWSKLRAGLQLVVWTGGPEVSSGSTESVRGGSGLPDTQ